MADETIGKRIAAYRRRRGMSQEALAGLIGRSESWLSQVERGLRSVDRLSVLLDLAKVLHTDVETLSGRPWRFAPNGAAMTDGLADVRRAFTRYDQLLGDSPPSTSSLTALRTSVADTHRDYQAAKYQRVITTLPALLAEADRLRGESANTADAREISLAYVSAYVVAAKLVTKLGATDLALLASDRAASEAYATDSLGAAGMAAYQVACALLRADQPQDAEHLAVRMAERLERAARSDRPTLVSLAGALWLIAAIIASRQTERDIAWARLDHAARLADMLGQDANYAWTAFGPTNVAIHRVSVAAELGDAGGALTAALDVDLTKLPAGLASRRAQTNLDLAWAHAQRRHDTEATLYLLQAEKAAPEAIAHNVIVQEMMRDMLARGSRASTNALAALAQRAGLLN